MTRNQLSPQVKTRVEFLVARLKKTSQLTNCEVRLSGERIKTVAEVAETSGIPNSGESGYEDAGSVVDYLDKVGDADIGEKNESIPEDEQQQILGTYVYGKSKNEQIQILVERGELRIKRTGRVGRRLARTGVRQYHPTGAPEVRIRFDRSSERASSVTIEDAALSLVAKRT